MFRTRAYVSAELSDSPAEILVDIICWYPLRCVRPQSSYHQRRLHTLSSTYHITYNIREHSRSLTCHGKNFTYSPNMSVSTNVHTINCVFTWCLLYLSFLWNTLNSGRYNWSLMRQNICTATIIQCFRELLLVYPPVSGFHYESDILLVVGEIGQESEDVLQWLH